MSNNVAAVFNELIKLTREKGVYKIHADLETVRNEFTKEAIGREILKALDTEEEAFLRGWRACLNYWREKGVVFPTEE